VKLHLVVARVRFCIELDLGSEPIGGHLLAGEYTRSFEGWLDLATGIEALRSKALEVDSSRRATASLAPEPLGNVAELADRRAGVRSWRSRF
jgi:hypothetical protein